MKKLGLDVIDLFLIHWPLPMFDQYVETWRAFEKLLADGRVRSIGVSNFEIPHLQRLLAETDVTPAVNQVELHPEFPQEELRTFHDEHGILTESWGPLGQGKGLLENPEIGDVARRRGRTPAQVVLRWHVQLGCVVIPKSVQPIGCGRTSTCLTSNSMIATWPRSQELGPASVWAPTLTSSPCANGC
jgi:2,5-diketo-D-gluconate reductase A